MPYEFVALNQGALGWSGMTAAPNGDVYACIGNGGDIYIQAGGSGDFIALNQQQLNWTNMAANPNTGDIYVVSYGDGLFKRSGGIGDFIYVDSDSGAFAVTVAPNGDIYLAINDWKIFKQVGVDWIEQTQTTRAWRGMGSALNGDIYAASWEDDIFVQAGGIGDFIPLGLPFIRDGHPLWYYGIASDLSNGDVYISDYAGDVYKRTAGIGDFVALGQPFHNWLGMCVTPTEVLYANSQQEDIFEYESTIRTDFSGTPTSLYAGSTVQFTDLSTWPSPISWDWDFGDGSLHSSLQTPPPHLYNVPNQYTISLIVTDESGPHSKIKINYISVLEPAADFSGDPVSGPIPLTVNFTDLTQPSDRITVWDWDFGDGSSHGSTQNPSHIYTAINTYTVVLRATISGWGIVENTKIAYIDAQTPFCEDPIIDPNGGSFTNPVLVRLSCSTPGVSIRYTLDGTEPSPSSLLYVNPFYIALDGVTLRAKAYKTNYIPSNIVETLFNFTCLYATIDNSYTGSGHLGTFNDQFTYDELKVYSSSNQIENYFSIKGIRTLNTDVEEILGIYSNHWQSQMPDINGNWRIGNIGVGDLRLVPEDTFDNTDSRIKDAILYTRGDIHRMYECKDVVLIATNIDVSGIVGKGLTVYGHLYITEE